MLKLTQFCNFKKKSMFLKIAAQAFEVGDFLNNLLKF